MQILRRHVFKNILNCRDIGGYPTADGATQFGRFLRCGIVNTPEDWEIQKLCELGVTTAIDLRGTYEVGETPLELERIEGADVYNLPLYEFNVATQEGMNLPLNEIYDMIINTQQVHIARVLHTIANAKDGVIMYNCFFGKDRTGILTMLLLSIAGQSGNVPVGILQTVLRLGSSLQRRKLFPLVFRGGTFEVCNQAADIPIYGALGS